MNSKSMTSARVPPRGRCRDCTCVDPSTGFEFLSVTGAHVVPTGLSIEVGHSYFLLFSQLCNDVPSLKGLT